MIEARRGVFAVKRTETVNTPMARGEGGVVAMVQNEASGRIIPRQILWFIFFTNARKKTYRPAMVEMARTNQS